MTTDTVFSFLRTATVDLSAVTLAATDASEFVEILATGGIGDDGLVTTKTIIGSGENDLVSTAAGDGDDTTLDLILDLGGDNGAFGDPLNVIPDDLDPINGDPAQEFGDVIVTPDGSDIQVIAGEGFDATISVDTLVSVQVAAGAEFAGSVILGDTIELDAESTNDGVATLAVLPIGAPIGVGNSLIDVSEALGANGWNLIGGELADTLIGSEQDDNINGGNSDQQAGEADELTGNGGADVFGFNLELSSPAAPTVTVDMSAIDEETLNFTADGADDDNEELDITIRINGTAQVINVDLSGVDVTVEADVEAAVATALNGLSGITAIISGGGILITADNDDTVDPMIIGAVELISVGYQGLVTGLVDTDGEVPSQQHHNRC
jgi:hypothetical protein